MTSPISPLAVYRGPIVGTLQVLLKGTLVPQAHQGLVLCTPGVREGNTQERMMSMV